MNDRNVVENNNKQMYGVKLFCLCGLDS